VGIVLLQQDQRLLGDDYPVLHGERASGTQEVAQVRRRAQLVDAVHLDPPHEVTMLSQTEPDAANPNAPTAQPILVCCRW
jgi:hypothetical protein